MTIPEDRHHCTSAGHGKGFFSIGMQSLPYRSRRPTTKGIKHLHGSDAQHKVHSHDFVHSGARDHVSKVNNPTGVSYKAVIPDNASIPSKRSCPQPLHLLHEDLPPRSPTEMSMTTMSSIPDSATTASSRSTAGSIFTVASPGSSISAQDLQDLLASSRPGSRILHRPQALGEVCWSLNNDEDGAPTIPGFTRQRNEHRDLSGDIIDPQLSVSTLSKLPR